METCRDALLLREKGDFKEQFSLEQRAVSVSWVRLV